MTGASGVHGGAWLKSDPAFWMNVEFSPDENGCWVWVGQIRQGSNYGIYGSKYAHRVAYEMVNGPVPARKQVLHHCDNRPCVRFDHLFNGTHAINSADMISKGRAAWQQPGFVAPRGENARRAKFTQQQAEEIRKLYATGEFTQRELAARFGVSQSPIAGIVRGKTYKEDRRDYDGR